MRKIENTEINPAVAPTQKARSTWKKPEITVADVSGITRNGSTGAHNINDFNPPTSDLYGTSS